MRKIKTLKKALKEVDKSYKFHPLCLKFPLLSEKRMDVMAKRMLKFGQYHHIISVNNEILDGRIRLLLCTMAEIKPRIVDMILDEQQCADLVTQLNLDRRDIGSPAERIKIAKEISLYLKNIRNVPKLEDLNLIKLQELAEFKEIANIAGSKVQTVAKYEELTKKAKKDKSIQKSLDKLESGKKEISIERLFQRSLSKVRRKPKKSVDVPKQPTEIELRQEIEDKKEEIKNIKLKSHHWETLYYEVKNIAIKKGFWENILKELIPTIEKKESPFPTPKQLREAGLL